MIYLIVAIIFGVLWLEYEIKDPNGRLYDLFHDPRG